MTAFCRLDHSSWLFVSQALPGCALDEHLGPTAVRDLPGVVAEGEFVHVFIEMAFADVVIHAGDATLEDAEEAFGAVRVDRATGVFALRVVDRFMREEAASDVLVQL